MAGVAVNITLVVVNPTAEVVATETNKVAEVDVGSRQCMRTLR